MSTLGPDGYPFSTLALSRRLETAEGRGSAEFVATRARLSPASGATWRNFDGTLAMFDGLGSPLTQTFGLGLFAPVTAEALAPIEAFFRERGADLFHEVSPLAGGEAAATLSERGYQPFEFTSVLHQPLPSRSIGVVESERIHVRRIDAAERDLWTRIGAEGWSEFPEVVPFMTDIGVISTARPDAACFLAEIDGRPVATGLVSMHEGVAVLAGASTIPSGRRQGAQLALLRARLAYAQEMGCDLAMMGAVPGSPSQRNAERHGFRIAYTRVKWRKLNAA